MKRWHVERIDTRDDLAVQGGLCDRKRNSSRTAYSIQSDHRNQSFLIEQTRQHACKTPLREMGQLLLHAEEIKPE